MLINSVNKTNDMNAVITADVVDYTKLANEQADAVLNNVSQLIEALDAARFNVNNFYVKRGDSIQGELDNPKNALKVALLLKTAINRVNYKKGSRDSKIIDIRVAVGIGEVIRRKGINESSGDAYIFSGRTLDGMKKSKRLITIKTFDDNMNGELEAELKLLEVIMARWTAATSEILYWTLLGMEEKRVAEKLGIKQPAVSQAKKRAGWSGIEALLERFQQLMEREGL